MLVIYIPAASNLKINNQAIQIIGYIPKIIAIILCIILFKLDRLTLKKNGAYTPEWGWFFLMPVYIFLRQKRNNLGLEYFAVYMIEIVMVGFSGLV